ncbi:hypothetical protein CC2G_009510 [Coprinopsis cinerea AmutBmut pab1-1]|nr:hypothetical protein CC2G_004881 [Coprinopsis cinerea AmutBmut pab1-1]KAG2016335.1 hypothetical protein CC2G_009510 [Coprinopsis cinerea AmutBmut pab1-1]
MSSEVKSPKPTWSERMKAAKLSEQPSANGLTNLLSLYHRSKESTACRSLELPPLPPRASGYPTACLSRNEVEEFLPPLLKRGWRIEFGKQQEGNADPEDCGCSAPESTGDAPPPPYLVKRFLFHDKLAKAKIFLEDVKVISNIGENHHFDDYLVLPSEDGSSSELTLYVQTHSGKKPARPSSSDIEWIETPGLTIRDVRYAILLEHLYISHFSDPSQLPAFENTAGLSSEVIEKLL